MTRTAPSLSPSETLQSLPHITRPFSWVDVKPPVQSYFASLSCWMQINYLWPIPIQKKTCYPPTAHRTSLLSKYLSGISMHKPVSLSCPYGSRASRQGNFPHGLASPTQMMPSNIPSQVRPSRPTFCNPERMCAQPSPPKSLLQLFQWYQKNPRKCHSLASNPVKSTYGMHQ